MHFCSSCHRTRSPSVSLGTAVPIKNGSAELNYRVDTKLPSAIARMMPGSGLYRVLDTDYENYAILWSCSNLTVMHAGTVFYSTGTCYNKTRRKNLYALHIILTLSIQCISIAWTLNVKIFLPHVTKNLRYLA